jgi:hypothetical protein
MGTDIEKSDGAARDGPDETDIVERLEDDLMSSGRRQTDDSERIKRKGQARRAEHKERAVDFR